jgi:hypothetical protein
MRPSEACKSFTEQRLQLRISVSWILLLLWLALPAVVGHG